MLPYLKSGFMYWHGRDRNCRPCLVLRLERLGAIARDKEAAVRLVIFTLEYALRTAMVPGRVENWVVIIDLENVLKQISPWQVHSYLATATALGQTLEQVYCGRMVWIKIVNLPGGDFLKKAINGVIPAEKKSKVSFPCNVAAAFTEHFEPNQLEARYGGTAPNLEPEDTYPYKFFPGCTGVPNANLVIEMGSEESEESVEPEVLSLHEATDLEFYEGFLWDDSSVEVRNRWMPKARKASLTPAAAVALSQMLGDGDGKVVKPCGNLQDWYDLRPQAPIARVESFGSGVTVECTV